MKTIILFFMLAFITSGSDAAVEIDPLLEIKTLVSKLNALSDLKVQVQKTKECGFRLLGRKWEKEKATLSFCDNDVKPFLDTSSPKFPVNDLLTIIAHEYAHALIDYDRNIETVEYTEDRFDSSAMYIYQELTTVQSWDFLVKAILSFKDPEDTEEEHITGIVFEELNNAEHENIDTLGVKLLLILNYTPSADLFSSLSVLSEWEGRNLNVRAKKVAESISEGLKDWESFNCTGNGIFLEEASPSLKKLLIKNQLSSIQQKVNHECTDQEIFNTFIDTVKRRHAN